MIEKYSITYFNNYIVKEDTEDEYEKIIYLYENSYFWWMFKNFEFKISKVAHLKNTVYTSYSINKGEQIVFCLRSKMIRNKLHDFNLIMYVVLHEMAHVGCPEIGHTELFKKIFALFASEAVKMGLYEKIEFRNNNKEYCGMQITDSII